MGRIRSHVLDDSVTKVGLVRLLLVGFAETAELPQGQLIPLGLAAGQLPDRKAAGRSLDQLSVRSLSGSRK